MANPQWSSRNRTAWNQIREQVKHRDTHCHLCGQAIDYTLPARQPGSFEVDHQVPLSAGGSMYDLDNCRASHRGCNVRKGGTNRVKPLYKPHEDWFK